MANDVGSNVELVLVAEKQGISLDENYVDTNTTSELVDDQRDSRATDPDGAQSPASSTYADCEETDSPTAESSPQKLPIDSTESFVDELSTSIDERIEMPISIEKSLDLNATVEIDVNSSEPDVPKIESEVASDEKSDSIIIDDDFKIEQSPSNTPDDQIEDIDEQIDCITSKIEECDLENDRSDHENSGDSDHSGFETENGEHYRENGDGEEVDGEEVDGEEVDGEEVDEEEPVIEKKLDDDEDRRNPQYIPKKGFFYEHDDRTAEMSSNEEADEKTIKKEAEAKEAETKGKRKRVIPDGRWQHDLYREEEQSSKSAQELIDIYGYDIRNEESAPKARRRRKYGRGPNKYTRKWDDETAYGKPTSNRRVRPVNQRLPRRKEEYEAEFPALKEDQSCPDARNNERRAPPRKKSPVRESSYSDQDAKYSYRKKNEPRESVSRRIIAQNAEPLPSKSRNFSKRISDPRDGSSPQVEHSVSPDFRKNQNLARKPADVTSNPVRGRGRGLAAARAARYTGESRYPESRAPFTEGANGNRSRDPRLARWSREFKSSKFVDDDDMHDLTHHMASVDLKSMKRTIIVNSANSNDVENNAKASLTEQTPNQEVSIIRSKRYSHQRQRQLPESNNQTSTTPGLAPTVTVQSLQNLSNEMKLNQPGEQTRASVPFVTQTQLASQPPLTQAAEPTLPVNTASVPSSSMPVSSLISLSAPPLTGSTATLPSGAPPLSIVGFYPHPQESVMGYTGQGAPTQLYARDQNVMPGPGNPPVQLVAFLPPSPMISNSNHSQTTAPPPPPPPPPTYPTPVMSYQQPSQTPQTQPSFANETYSLPPVTLAPIPQTPEMYQSRGGVTYYNTRSQFKARSPPPPRVKIAIPIVPPPSSETMK